jgi:MinD superfamily P-loop ATPase
MHQGISSKPGETMIKEIVIVSGKGGTGKTSITAAFASFAEHAVFTDCDVDAADLHLLLSPEIHKSERFASGAKAVVDHSRCTHCGLCQDLCRYKAIDQQKGELIIDEFVCEGCGLCAVACPVKAISIENYENNHIYLANSRFGTMVYGKLGIAEENSGRLVSKIRQYAREEANSTQASYIITDGPPGIGCPVISSVTGADMVIAITEPTLSGWHDLERLMDMTARFKAPVYVIMNKFDLNEEMAYSLETKIRNRGIELLGKIPYDENMVYALLEGKTIPEFEPDGILARKLRAIWRRVMSIAANTL